MIRALITALGTIAAANDHLTALKEKSEAKAKRRQAGRLPHKVSVFVDFVCFVVKQRQAGRLPHHPRSTAAGETPTPL